MPTTIQHVPELSEGCVQQYRQKPIASYSQCRVFAPAEMGL